MNRYRKLIGLLLIMSVAFVQACKKPRSDIGAIMFKESRNRVYKKVDSAAFYKVFRQVLEEQKDSIANSTLIQDFYKKNEYEPYFIVNFFPKEQLKYLTDTYAKAPEHGLTPEYFNYSQLKPLVDRLYERKGIRKVEDAYRDIAKTEILVANSLVKYSTVLQYGMVNPRKIFPGYYMKTETPDTASMNKVFAITDMKEYLADLQPKSKEYKKLQDALKTGFIYQGLTAEQTRTKIQLNLERLRWKNMPETERYIWVNIPDYSLTYYENGKPDLTMKVCVGKGPEQSLADADYDISEGAVRPHNHQTPQMEGIISYAQVNPVWNIPNSIAKNEIIDLARNDPYYLANANIEVYDSNGDPVDPDYIDWSGVSKTNLPYSFKQGSGEGNALGKIKFMFPNRHNIYLHDTPAQAAFDKDVRAVSHGCVRVEKPVELARALFGNGSKFNTIQRELSEDNPTARDITLPEKVPVYIDYRTCFIDTNGQIQIRDDVYQTDRLLYNRLKKALAN